MYKKYFWMVVLATLVLATLACGSSSNNTGIKVGEATSVPAVEATDNISPKSTDAPAIEATAASPTSEKPNSFKVGDIVESKDFRIALNGGDYKGGILKLNFSISNTGSKDLSVSSMIGFSAKDNEGTKLEQSLFDCGSALDGKVLPNDKLRGDLCYTLPNPGKFKVYFENDLFSSGAVVWDLDSAELTGIPETALSLLDDTSPLESYKVGDVVELQDQQITMNEASIAGNILKANFTIENKGSEDLNVSSLLSFSARGPDGTILEMAFMDCGGSPIDGKVLPSDKVKGDICWNTSGVVSANIYYEAVLFGSGAVVWEVK